MQLMPVSVVGVVVIQEANHMWSGAANVADVPPVPYGPVLPTVLVMT